jgi:retron-type reverse transcriptase
MHRNSENVSTKQKRIAALAKQSPEMAFTSLAYLMDIDWLKEAYRRTRKDGAVGVDGVTAEEYEQDLEGNLHSLLDRAKSGTYQAPPVRRVHIPKGGSSTETRPLGIPTLEDKILQRAIVMLLEPIYEQDFLDCSYGFRPGRSAHQALESFRDQTMTGRPKGGWVLEVDIRKFFDNLEHRYLRQFLQLRVRDGVLLRLIDKWLKAGVMEDGNVCYLDSGTPQGGVVSPLISNVFLHYVLDRWFEQDVKPRLRQPAFLIRYADDCVPGKAVHVMRGGPSQPACRGRLQTTLSCGSQELPWCALRKRHDIRSCQVRIRKTNASEPLMMCRKRNLTSKPGGSRYPGMSSGEICLLPERRPA